MNQSHDPRRPRRSFRRDDPQAALRRSLPPEVDEALDPSQDDRHKVFGLGIATAESRQPAYGQGVVVSLLAAAGLLLLAVISVGTGKDADPPVLEQTDALFWIIAVAVLVIAAIGAQFAERTATRAAEAVGEGRPLTSMATAWAVPFVATLSAVLLIATFHNRVMLIVGPLIGFLGVAGSLLSRDLLDEADEQSGRIASTLHTLVVHSVAFLAFSAIYLNKLSTALAAPAVGVIAGVLVLETLERGNVDPSRRVVSAILGGWIVGTMMVPLNWWPTYGWTGGAVLLAIFYATAGLMLVQAQRDRVAGRDLIEFAGVAGVALALLSVVA
ncbi:MAG: hypothetical protein QM589_06845 [Thermomicrobiales bacterium]